MLRTSAWDQIIYGLSLCVSLFEETISFKRPSLADDLYATEVALISQSIDVLADRGHRFEYEDYELTLIIFFTFFLSIFVMFIFYNFI